MRTGTGLIMAALLAGCATKAAEVGDAVRIKDPKVKPDIPTSEATTLELGRKATTELYAGDTAALHGRFSDAMVAALPAEAWAQVPQKIRESLGAEVGIVEESTATQLQNRFYRRYARFEAAGEQVLVVTWVFDAVGTITGFTITPRVEAAKTKYAEYRTKTPLRAPFEGEWTVVWGGRTVEQNYHASSVGQRFALDLLVSDADGRTHTGDGTKNEDYYAFGQDVLAPGAGKVVAAKNDIVDNIPDQMNPAEVAGNHVLIDHKNGEFSLLAHMQLGSVKVVVGDEVQQGDVLGSCGNSGNSSEPHIHYHLQNVAEPLGGEGLPLFFETATIDGTAKRGVELRQGQRVRP